MTMKFAGLALGAALLTAAPGAAAQHAAGQHPDPRENPAAAMPAVATPTADEEPMPKTGHQMWMAPLGGGWSLSSTP